MLWFVSSLALVAAISLGVWSYRLGRSHGYPVALLVTLVVLGLFAACIAVFGLMNGIVVACALIGSLFFAWWLYSQFGGTGFKVAVWIILIFWVVGGFLAFVAEADFVSWSWPTGDGSTGDRKCVVVRNLPLPWFTVRCAPN